MSDEQYVRNPREKPCFLCGKSKFTWGRVLAGETLVDDKATLFFRPDGAIFEDGDIPIYSRQCDICGNILIFSIES